MVSIGKSKPFLILAKSVVFLLGSKNSILEDELHQETPCC